MDSVIEEKIHSGDLSIEDIIGEMGMSSSTLYRKIKNFDGTSPTAYIRNYQLKKAASLLKANFGNISQVAYETGFNNLSYFAKCFKENFDLSPSEFAKKSYAARPGTGQTTSFIGRKYELAQVSRLIKENNLINLTGPPGTGKTRLAVEVINNIKHQFADGVFEVYLASISDPDLVCSALLESMHITKNPLKTAAGTFIDYAKHKEILILLDNFEHVTEASSDINTIIRQCPTLKILVTSRENLHISVETLFPVPTLPVPETRNEIKKSDLKQIKSCPSVRLFVDRARQILPDFDVNTENASSLITLTQRLDGLPLALELTASQLKIFSLGELLQWLERGIKVFKTAHTDRPERHYSLFNAISWSYNLLNREEQIFFQRLSLIPGSFDLYAAEALWQKTPDLEFLDILKSLIDKNLIQSFDRDGRMRFRILETLKAYGREKLMETQNKKEIVIVIALHFLQLAQKAETGLSGPKQKYWVKRINTELDNFRGMLAYLIQEREVKTGLQFCIALWHFWNMQNLMKEGRVWLQKMIALTNSVKNHKNTSGFQLLKARALSCLGILLLQISENYYEAAETLRQCVTQFRKLHKFEELATGLNHYSWTKINIGEYEESKKIVKEAIRLNKKLKNQRGLSVAYSNLASIAYMQGELRLSENLYLKSINIRENIGDRRGVAYLSTRMARVKFSMDRYDQAFELLNKAYDILNELNDKQLLSWVNTVKGFACNYLAKYGKVIELQEEAIPGWEEAGNRYGLAMAHGIMALSLIEFNETKRAKNHLEKADSLWKGMHCRWGDSFSKYSLAEWERSAGNLEAACQLQEEALKIRIGQGEKLYICESLESLSLLLMNIKNYRMSLKTLTVSSFLRENIGAPLPPRFENHFKNIYSMCKKELDHQEFDFIWQEGKSNPTEQLVEMTRNWSMS